MPEMGAAAGMKKGLFFDLYGTLIDIRTDENDCGVYEALARYLAYHSVNVTTDELRNAYFDGIQRYMYQSKETYPEVDVHRIFFDIVNRYSKKKYPKGMVTDITMLFRSLTIRRFGVFEGLYDVLSSLSSRYRTAIISDAQWVFAEPEMAVLGLDQFFKLRILSSRYGFKKPDARLFRIAMDKLGVTPEESVYIGDNPHKDLPGAKKAGMKFVLFGSECRDYECLRPDGCFNQYSELEALIRELL
jgi:putative hydrolase of the HAD superfamily